MPEYLISDLDALEVAGELPSAYVERVNPPPAPAHYRVLCRLECPWPEGFVAFRDPRHEPYANSAAA